MVCIRPVDVDFNGYAGVAQLVELQFSKLNVASSSLVARSKTIEFAKVKSVNSIESTFSERGV